MAGVTWHGHVARELHISGNASLARTLVTKPSMTTSPSTRAAFQYADGPCGKLAVPSLPSAPDTWLAAEAGRIFVYSAYYDARGGGVGKVKVMAVLYWRVRIRLQCYLWYGSTYMVVSASIYRLPESGSYT